MAEQIVKVKIDLDVTEFNKNAKAMSAALSSVLGRDVEIFNGKIAKTKQLVEQTEKAMGAAASTINTAGNSVKKSNQQWTNFALVIQDLPYGFRGIQNNLPALMGGIAGMAGPLYLVGSAVIALFTAWDAGMFKTISTLSILKKANEEYAESAKSAAGNAGEEISKIKALTVAASNQELIMSKRLAAVKQLQDEYPSYFGNLSQESILNGEVTESVNKVSLAILERAKATAVASKINKLSAEKFVQEERLYQLALQKTFKIQKAIAFANLTKAAGYEGTTKNLEGLINSQISGIRKEEGTIKNTVNGIDKELSRLQGIYEKTTSVTVDLDRTNAPKTGKKPKAKKEKEDIFDLTKTTKEFYAAKLNFAENDEIAQKEILLREQQTINELIDSNQMSFNEYYSWSSEIYKKLSDLKIKEDKRFFTESERIASQQAKNVEVELGIQEKLHKGSLAQRIEDTKAAMAQLAAMAMMSLDPASMAVYLDMFDKMDAKLKGYGTTWKQTSETISKAMNDLAVNSAISLSESLGKALAGEDVDAFVALGSVLADALSQIGKALISFAILEGTALESLKNPLSWPVALAAGVAAVAAGALLKSTLSADKTKKFANGGIISGPTMGLMGEYPGAANNPEVVAPLDKLKEMIGGNGGGSGQFVLRGQDLLLSVNRAQKASNLKGQNISLI
jgi:hypothetical protein